MATTSNFTGGPTPMISIPPKHTVDIDWAGPLKQYLRDSNSVDPDSFSDECAQLNRLRQDMNGATTSNSVNSKDLLYRYYGQLELLDLRFPIDESNIRLTFTWDDAFTHVPTSQFSLAFEKASILFNIGSVLSSQAVACDRRVDEHIKLAYHSFKSSAGLFTYINQNFLHAPSFDLQTNLVENLTRLMLAQAQEVFLERLLVGYVAEQAGRSPSDAGSMTAKPSMLAKLAIEAANQYSLLSESLKALDFSSSMEKSWTVLIQVKAHYMTAIAHYFQASVDSAEDRYGSAISRLQVSEKSASTALKLADSLSPDPSSKTVPTDAGSTIKRILDSLIRASRERLTEAVRDNDYIYHQAVPLPDGLVAITPLVGAHPTPVSELYKGQDIQEIIGPDIFQKFVPMAVTEAVSRYDEEKAKLVRGEAELISTQVAKMRVTLERLKLPESLDLLAGNVNYKSFIPESFQGWCAEMLKREPFEELFGRLDAEKASIEKKIREGITSLNREETLCEMMRKKYGELWTQEESKELTQSFRVDIENYQKAMREAAESDKQLRKIFDKFRSDFTAMREAGRLGESEVLFQQAILEAGAKRSRNSPTGSESVDLLNADLDTRPSIDAQVNEIRTRLEQLQEVSDTRVAILEKLRERVRKDDISQTLIRTIRAGSSGDEPGLFKKQLEKFRSYRQHIAEANTKQGSILSMIVQLYEVLLLDDRVKKRQREHETLLRRSKDAVSRFTAVYQGFTDLNTGLERARSFYSDMASSVEDLALGIRRFVDGRRAEGSQLLSLIETVRSRKSSVGSSGGSGYGHALKSPPLTSSVAAAPASASAANSTADSDGRMLQELMDRMALGPTSSNKPSSSAGNPNTAAAIASIYGNNPPMSPPPNGHHPSMYTQQSSGPLPPPPPPPPASAFGFHRQNTGQHIARPHSTNTYDPYAYASLSSHPHPPPGQLSHSQQQHQQYPNQYRHISLPPGSSQQNWGTGSAGAAHVPPPPPPLPNQWSNNIASASHNGPIPGPAGSGSLPSKGAPSAGYANPPPPGGMATAGGRGW